ncbi:Signal peptidase I [Clostridium neonatale]|nr:Signal peptidase I [Clostridium neonatale]CAI3630292.1 Signal peptidase I [Clostridium neonatale]
MVPTLEVNDRLIVSNVYKPENLKEGDIVTFKCDEYGDKLLIKRLIGLPGDTIEIKDGVVFRNGTELEEPYVKNNEEYDGYFEIPEGKYFFLGDNRANSDDSRYWENPYVDRKDIEGKVQIRIYPFNEIGKVD